MPINITPSQLKRLQTLDGQFARRAVEAVAGSRDDRLKRASEFCKRPIGSFKDLTRDEARAYIDYLQGIMGRRVPPKQRSGRDEARRQGIDGRHDGAEFRNAPQLASGADFDVIESFYHRLGWTRERFDAWMRSPRSPLKHKSNPQIRTLADANKVRWALKGMLVHAGLWDKAGAA